MSLSFSRVMKGVEGGVICRYALFILIQSFYMILYAFIIRFKC